jgi:hypothetical protein
VLPGRATSKANASPSAAAVAVIESIISWARSTVVPYLLARFCA